MLARKDTVQDQATAYIPKVDPGNDRGPLRFLGKGL
jgi:hypothetical protein